MSKELPTSSPLQGIAHTDRRLTASEFQGLADIPPEH